MLAPKIAAEVRRLLALGKLSQRKIARLTGISRGTVGSIASGKRLDRETTPQPWDDGWEEPEGPPERCPCCGGMVYMPCRLCLVRKTLAENPRSAPDERAFQLADPPGLNLRCEHRARFEEVLALRREGAAIPAVTKR